MGLDGDPECLPVFISKDQHFWRTSVVETSRAFPLKNDAFGDLQGCLAGENRKAEP